MAALFDLDPWWRYGAALLIGMLIGLEREFIQQQTAERDFAGIRTFSLVTLLGAVMASLAESYGLTPVLVGLAGVTVLALSSYVLSNIRDNDEPGITTEVAVMLAFMLGALLFLDHPQIPIALAVIVALLLAIKQPLHRLARRMSQDDLRVTLEFALVAAVVLPILPNGTIDPFGLLNPFQVWLLVVFVSGIGSGGYVLMKILGAQKGIGLTGLLGGIASSTATTVSFATRSKESPALSPLFAQAIIIASTVMFPRLFIVLAVASPALVPLVAPPLAAMLVTGLLTVAWLWYRGERQDRGEDAERAVEITNPLKLSTAILFGLLFAVVLIGVRVLQQFFGDAGVYIASVVTGLTDVDAISLSVARLVQQGQLDVTVAGTAVIIAVVMNTLAKAGIALSAGSQELRRSIIPAFTPMVVVGIISLILMIVL